MSIVRHSLLLLIGLALGCIWLASAAGNFAHGVQLAGASPYWWVYGLASASADVLKATALLGLTPAWRARWGGLAKAWAIAGLLLIFVLTLGWGVRSCAGFISTTLSDTVSSREMHGVADKSLTRQIDDQVAQVTKLQDLKMRSPSKDWERIEAEIGRVEGRLDKLRAKARTEVSAGRPDPIGDLLKRWLDPETTRLGTVVLFLLMLEAVASMGLMAFAPLLGIDYNRIASLLTGEGHGEGARERASRREDPLMLVPPLKGEGKLKLVPAGPLRMEAIELLARLEAKYGAGSAIWTSEVWNAYLALAKERGWKAMASHKLGQQLICLGVTKTDPDSAKRKYYVLPTAREKAQRKRGKEEGGLPVA